MAGGVGWYRKDFALPNRAARCDWAVRFESVNYRSQVWLNGRPSGTHRGAYLPFELALDGPPAARAPTGSWCASTRAAGDRLPAGRRRRRPACRPAAGGTTAGILREVYLRAARHGRLRAGRAVRPRLALPHAAPRRVRRRARAAQRRPRRRGASRSTGPLRRPRRVGSARAAIRGRRRRAVHGDAARSANPRLWSPAHAVLYPSSLEASAGGRARRRLPPAQRASARSGSRGGQLLLNGQPVHLRGVGFHEDSGRRASRSTTRAAAARRARPRRSARR